MLLSRLETDELQFLLSPLMDPPPKSHYEINAERLQAKYLEDVTVLLRRFPCSDGVLAELQTFFDTSVSGRPLSDEAIAVLDKMRSTYQKQYQKEPRIFANATREAAHLLLGIDPKNLKNKDLFPTPAYYVKTRTEKAWRATFDRFEEVVLILLDQVAPVD